MTHLQRRAIAQRRNTKALLITSLLGLALGSINLIVTGDQDYLILIALTTLSTLIALIK
jgi:hypothetical protein